VTPGGRLTPQDRRTIAALTRAGRLPREIAAALGCNRVTVRRVVAQLGLSRPPGGRRPRPRVLGYWQRPRAPMFVWVGGREWRV